ncbi:hypothetical protein CONLIGDRAFT_648131 [Coniochaeta ligniaria NRRL 30616]|uniref:Uncharacterized protein n=1 Tax=Coniochaeta ligniaria NRRL 30616 TaxID=1408157 RepID=A0A1J7JBX7_9PEZI|nr:hypothetical protein CONLIGDRAFT_648131 [Coniochaeta ligniaria NRRL 30616]
MPTWAAHAPARAGTVGRTLGGVFRRLLRNDTAASHLAQPEALRSAPTDQEPLQRIRQTTSNDNGADAIGSPPEPSDPTFEKNTQNDPAHANGPETEPAHKQQDASSNPPAGVLLDGIQDSEIQLPTSQDEGGTVGSKAGVNSTSATEIPTHAPSSAGSSSTQQAATQRPMPDKEDSPAPAPAPKTGTEPPTAILLNNASPPNPGSSHAGFGSTENPRRWSRTSHLALSGAASSGSYSSQMPPRPNSSHYLLSPPLSVADQAKDDDEDDDPQVDPQDEAEKDEDMSDDGQPRPVIAVEEALLNFSPPSPQPAIHLAAATSFLRISRFTVLYQLLHPSRYVRVHNQNLGLLQRTALYLLSSSYPHLRESLRLNLPPRPNYHLQPSTWSTQDRETNNRVMNYNGINLVEQQRAKDVATSIHNFDPATTRRLGHMLFSPAVPLYSGMPLNHNDKHLGPWPTHRGWVKMLIICGALKLYVIFKEWRRARFLNESMQRSDFDNPEVAGSYARPPIVGSSIGVRGNMESTGTMDVIIRVTSILCENINGKDLHVKQWVINSIDQDVYFSKPGDSGACMHPRRIATPLGKRFHVVWYDPWLHDAAIREQFPHS